ncbi:MAG TPA: exodeoxyribonuclease VII small subunit [Candidatus Paceibacterota bacterium]
MDKEKPNKASASMGKLEAIVKWFESQRDVDVEEGLKKVKEGAVLIKELRGKLKHAENEFREVKASLKEDEDDA